MQLFHVYRRTWKFCRILLVSRQEGHSILVIQVLVNPLLCVCVGFGDCNNFTRSYSLVQSALLTGNPSYTTLSLFNNQPVYYPQLPPVVVDPLRIFPWFMFLAHKTPVLYAI